MREASKHSRNSGFNVFNCINCNKVVAPRIKKLQHPNRRKRLEDVVLVPYNYKVTINNPNGGEDTYFEGCVFYEEAYKKWQEAVDVQVKAHNENNVPFRSVHFYRDNKRLFSEL